jgi:SUMO ligase MMS21 Smc5/6 complex component
MDSKFIFKDVCPICLSNKDKNIIKLDCGHLFHMECIDNWLDVQQTCPICRRQIFGYFLDSFSDYVMVLSTIWHFLEE